MIYEGGAKVHWERAERTDFQRDRARLQWSAPQPHGACDLQPITAKMILNYFATFFQVNSGAIMSASLLLYMVKPELTVSEKFEYVHHFFSR